MALPWLRRLTSPAAKFLVAVTGVLAVVAPLTVVALHHPGRLRVATAQVTDGPIVRRITAMGTLQAVATVPIGAHVSGTIQSLDADDDSIVHAGQVVAKIDPSLFQAEYQEAAANLQAAVAAEAQAQASRQRCQGALVEARARLTRAEQLTARQMLAVADLDAVRLAFTTANAEVQGSAAQVVAAHVGVEQAQAALDQARASLDLTVITSPIDGVVVTRGVEVGQMVQASGQTPVLFVVAPDLHHVRLAIDVDAADLPSVALGEDVSFEVDEYPEAVFSGTVSNVRPTMIEMPNPDGKLRPGMTATVTLRGDHRERAVRIPSSALAFRPSMDMLDERAVTAARPTAGGDSARRLVWEFDGTRFTPVAVHVGLADDRWIEMVDGALRPGDALVTSAAMQP